MSAFLRLIKSSTSALIPFVFHLSIIWSLKSSAFFSHAHIEKLTFEIVHDIILIMDIIYRALQFQKQCFVLHKYLPTSTNSTQPQAANCSAHLQLSLHSMLLRFVVLGMLLAAAVCSGETTCCPLRHAARICKTRNGRRLRCITRGANKPSFQLACYSINGSGRRKKCCLEGAARKIAQRNCYRGSRRRNCDAQCVSN